MHRLASERGHPTTRLVCIELAIGLLLAVTMLAMGRSSSAAAMS